MIIVILLGIHNFFYLSHYDFNLLTTTYFIHFLNSQILNSGPL